VTTVSRQLPLQWPHAASFAREDFLAAPENVEALRLIESWPKWPSPTLLLIGPKGSGKSHLGAIWAAQAQARETRGDALRGADLVSLASGPALLIDDVDRVGSAEAELFHLLNLLKEHAVGALMTASSPPDAWGLRTADLLSRLRLAPIARLGAPEPDLLRAVLFKLFSDRQLVVEPPVVNYLAMRLERSLDAARAIVEALDREALARGKAVTRALAAELLRDDIDTP
jgi:chromosomal replication initiation ATPase DnaA